MAAVGSPLFSAACSACRLSETRASAISTTISEPRQKSLNFDAEYRQPAIYYRAKPLRRRDIARRGGGFLGNRNQPGGVVLSSCRPGDWMGGED
jgi:hypothetical protein